MDKSLDQMETILSDLQDKDDNIYRVVFEADPISKSVREAGYGGVDRFKHLENYKNKELMELTAKKLEKVKRELLIETTKK